MASVETQKPELDSHTSSDIRDRLERIADALARASADAQEAVRARQREGHAVLEGAFVCGWLEQSCKNAVRELWQLVALLVVALAIFATGGGV